MLWWGSWLRLLGQRPLGLLLTLCKWCETSITRDRWVGHDASEQIIGTMTDRGRSGSMK